MSHGTTITLSELEPVSSTLRHALLQRLGDGVDIIFEFGSRQKGNEHPYSDWDLCYVPREDTEWSSITVLVGGMLFDLFPIQWSGLEKLADFEHPNCTILLKNRIAYARSPEVEERFMQLGQKVCQALQPEERPRMLRKAQELYQRLGYPAYLLRLAERQGNRAAAVQQSQAILHGLFHCLGVLNQRCIDTRKMDQLISLPILPEEFKAKVDRVAGSCDPAALSAGCEELLDRTRELILQEQRRVLFDKKTYPELCDAMYPEAKGDVYHILLGCDRGDYRMIKTSVVSLYHELGLRVEQAENGLSSSAFNMVDDYGVGLEPLGFPDLFEPLARNDLEELRRRAVQFDRRMKEFFSERGVKVNDFANLQELDQALSSGAI